MRLVIKKGTNACAKGRGKPAGKTIIPAAEPAGHSGVGAKPITGSRGGVKKENSKVKPDDKGCA